MSKKWLDIKLLKFALPILAVATVTNAIASNLDDRDAQQLSSLSVSSLLDSEDKAEEGLMDDLTNWAEINTDEVDESKIQESCSNDTSFLTEAYNIYIQVPRLLSYARGKDSDIQDIGTAMETSQAALKSLQKLYAVGRFYLEVHQDKVYSAMNLAMELRKNIQGTLPSLPWYSTTDDSQEAEKNI